jgi:hypothetical protein
VVVLVDDVRLCRCVCVRERERESGTRLFVCVLHKNDTGSAHISLSLLPMNSDKSRNDSIDSDKTTKSALPFGECCVARSVLKTEDNKEKKRTNETKGPTKEGRTVCCVCSHTRVCWFFCVPVVWASRHLRRRNLFATLLHTLSCTPNPPAPLPRIYTCMQQSRRRALSSCCIKIFGCRRQSSAFFRVAAHIGVSICVSFVTRRLVGGLSLSLSLFFFFLSVSLSVVAPFSPHPLSKAKTFTLSSVNVPFCWNLALSMRLVAGQVREKRHK